MTIQFRDFFPDVKKRGLFKTQYATLQETVEQANAWIAEAKVRVLNLETVVLPNILSAQQTTVAEARTSGEMSSSWYQVIRVWYET
jgi:hypothetical protein